MKSLNNIFWFRSTICYTKTTCGILLKDADQWQICQKMSLVLTERNLDLWGGAARLFHLFLFDVPCSANHESMAEVFLGDPEALPCCSQVFFKSLDKL